MHKLKVLSVNVQYVVTDEVLPRIPRWTLLMQGPTVNREQMKMYYLDVLYVSVMYTIAVFCKACVRTHRTPASISRLTLMRHGPTKETQCLIIIFIRCVV